MKVLTGIAIVNRSEGKRIAYTCSNVNEITGEIIEDNIKKSFIALNTDLLEHVKALEDYVKENKIEV
ncbi:hypothetical protein [Clostridium sp. Marseille-Q2269]|uniref:hypothetical protein n=1 Tax=Clostridium sp. Marseille-Q2269 TaxID=2942205 RepID=UPI002072E8F3|nr:hypothetical protein [Clostridium sp. Marseille-Q2269]